MGEGDRIGKADQAQVNFRDLTRFCLFEENYLPEVAVVVSQALARLIQYLAGGFLVLQESGAGRQKGAEIGRNNEEKAEQ